MNITTTFIDNNLLYICYTYIVLHACLPSTNQPTKSTTKPPRCTMYFVYCVCLCVPIVKIAGIGVIISREAHGKTWPRRRVHMAVRPDRSPIGLHCSDGVCGRRSGPGLCRLCYLYILLHRVCVSSVSILSSLSTTTTTTTTESTLFYL